jgi:hypothetical protein
MAGKLTKHSIQIFWNQQTETPVIWREIKNETARSGKHIKFTTCTHISSHVVKSEITIK